MKHKVNFRSLKRNISTLLTKAILTQVEVAFF